MPEVWEVSLQGLTPVSFGLCCKNAVALHFFFYFYIVTAHFCCSKMSECAPFVDFWQSTSLLMICTHVMDSSGFLLSTQLLYQPLTGSRLSVELPLDELLVGFALCEERGGGWDGKWAAVSASLKPLLG